MFIDTGGSSTDVHVAPPLTHTPAMLMNLMNLRGSVAVRALPGAARCISWPAVVFAKQSGHSQPQSQLGHRRSLAGQTDGLDSQIGTRALRGRKMQVT